MPAFTPVEGGNSVEVRQTDVAGNVSIASIAFAFTLDTTVPAAPTVALTADTGFSGADKITSNGALTLTGVEPGDHRAVLDRRRYDLDRQLHSSPRSQLGSGPTDGRGRERDGSAAFTFTLDTIAPAMITISDIVPNVQARR
ncbi:MAG: hypothetical protein U0744_06025 [Gemmataceae bacterium]